MWPPAPRGRTLEDCPPMLPDDPRLPKLWLPGKVVSQQLDVERGELVAIYTYDDGLVLRLFVDEDGARFEANRSYRVDEDGVVVFEGHRRPAAD